MKVIGRTKNGVIVEATEDELAKVQGEHYATSLPRPTFSNQDRFEPGTTINVSEAWRDLCEFRRAAEKIRGAAQTLHGVAQIAEACSAVYSMIEPAEATPTKS